MIRLKDILLEFDFNDNAELERGKKIYNGLIQRGFTHIGSIGLLGNIAHESGCNPDQGEIGGTGAYGICQWDPGYGRLGALKAFAKYIKSPVSSLNTQLDFMKCELLNGYYWDGKPVPGISEKLIYYKQKDGSYKGKSDEYVKKYRKSITSDIKTTTENLMYKVFSPKTGSLQKRINNAVKFEKYLNGDLENDVVDKKTNVYIVQDNDTLSGIAAKQPVGITINTIAAANNIDPTNPVIKPGQKLIIK